MIVRVAERAMRAQAKAVIVACDDASIVHACEQFHIQALLTDVNHPSGSDRLAEACALLNLREDEIVVNVQGDEPLIEPSMINAVAALLHNDPALQMSTVAHPIHSVAEFLNPNVVKVVLDKRSYAHYFSRAPIPWWRDGFANSVNSLPSPLPLRHVGLYGYRVGFLKRFPTLAPTDTERIESLEQLRALSHGYAVGVHVSSDDCGPGVDTPQDLERVRNLL